ncbi:MAG: hypothetical protein AAB804_03200 [Patescibacteria group bacterium]
MSPDPANSFLRFFVGFIVFISVSFGVTFAVQTYATTQNAAKQQAAAAATMLEYKR